MTEKKVKCSECFGKFPESEINTDMGVNLCEECHEQNVGFGQNEHKTITGSELYHKLREFLITLDGVDEVGPKMYDPSLSYRKDFAQTGVFNIIQHYPTKKRLFQITIE